MWHDIKTFAMGTVAGAALYWTVYVLPLRVKGWWRDRQSSRR